MKNFISVTCAIVAAAFILAAGYVYSVPVPAPKLKVQAPTYLYAIDEVMDRECFYEHYSHGCDLQKRWVEFVQAHRVREP